MTDNTKKELETRVALINHHLGKKENPWNFDSITKKSTANVGTYYIDRSYGGYRLEKITNKGGGCMDVSLRSTKKELNLYLKGMVEGLRALQ